MAHLSPSPIIQLNRAVAIAMAHDAHNGLDILEGLANDKTLCNYHLYHATCADLYRRANLPEKAKRAYERAIALCDNDREKSFLTKRLIQLA